MLLRRWAPRLAAASIGLALAAAPAGAAGRIKSQFGQAEQFGVYGGITRFDVTAFATPDIGVHTSNHLVCGTAYVHYCYATGGLMVMPLDLPNGAVLDEVYLYVVDTDCGNNITFELVRQFDAFTGDGHNVGSALAGNGATSGCNGYEQLALSPQLTIRTVDDVVGDSAAEAISHFFYVYTPSLSTAVNAIELHWHLSVSPAPQQATYGDVATSHPFFREIEALAASGITQGCGANDFCPDAPVTHAQLAYLMARALGLYWSR